MSVFNSILTSRVSRIFMGGGLWHVSFGFARNEAVAIFRIKVSEKMGSAALVADGYHAGVDAWPAWPYWSALSILDGLPRWPMPPSGYLFHVDPANVSGEEDHRIGEHSHDDLQAHSHS